MSTIIYGASDDNIEIEGDFYDEMYWGGDVVDILIGIGDSQCRATINYDGEWTIKVYGDDQGTEFAYHVYPAGSKDAERYSGRDYTDVLVFSDPVSFVVVGKIAERRNDY